MGMFGASQKRKSHVELVVLLKPTIVKPGPSTAGSRH
jgi:type II secretory pathway component GspD/PulD (secretin)